MNTSQVGDVDEEALLELEVVQQLLLRAIVHEGGAEGLKESDVRREDHY